MPYRVFDTPPTVPMDQHYFGAGMAYTNREAVKRATLAPKPEAKPALPIEAVQYRRKRKNS